MPQPQRSLPLSRQLVAATEAEQVLTDSLVTAAAATQVVHELAVLLDSDQISLEGIVVEPITDEDTVAKDARRHLALLR